MKYERSRKSDGVNKVKPVLRKLKSKPLVIVAGILLLFNVLWFISWAVSDKPGEEVASVDGKPIKREAWMAAMEGQIGQETLRNLVNEQVMEAAAKKYGIKVTDKEIDFELALLRTVENRAYAGVDMDSARKEIRSNIILEKVLTKDVVISNKAIKANFKENAAMYNVATAYRAAIIILSSDEEAKQALNELSGGSSFAGLAKERSLDISSANLGGDIGYISEATESIDQAIIEAVVSMEKDTTSNIITLEDGGYAIIHVSDVIKGKKFKLRNAKNYIKRELALEQLPQSVNTEAFWEEFDAKWFYGNK